MEAGGGRSRDYVSSRLIKHAQKSQLEGSGCDGTIRTEDTSDLPEAYL